MRKYAGLYFTCMEFYDIYFATSILCQELKLEIHNVMSFSYGVILKGVLSS